MDRRSWPWRRKSSEKTIAAAHSTIVSPVIPKPLTPKASDDPPQRIYLEQDVPKVPTENARVLEAVLRWQQAEETIKDLTGKLDDAQADAVLKDEEAKQHAKVAEEAVSGWEKAEAEALGLKDQCEAYIQQKNDADDQVGRLDRALKECMKQVRHVKEEQEEKIHEAILRKSREWDNIRLELEAKLSELGRQVLELGAENSAMSKSLQERARAIVEANEAKGKAEAEVKVLQVRLASLEKEISALNYELHVQNKELEIRNEERDYSRKAADAGHKQHLENVKKIAKLESECQRLRALLRKKLPGPAALAQMRMEVEGLGREMGEGRRRKPSTKSVPSTPESPRENIQQGFAMKEVEMLTERLLSMEEETKLLKEALAKRNGELQAARQLCARTASKLSVVEGQLEAFPKGQSFSKTLNNSPEVNGDPLLLGAISRDPSVASPSEDGGNDEETNCAESWASALIAELAHFKKGKTASGSKQSMESCNFDNVDDFLEIERQATLTGNEAAQSNEFVSEEVKCEDRTCLTELAKLWKKFASRELEIQAANQTCKDVGSKLSSVEEQLMALQSDGFENEATTARVQESLDRIYEAQKEVSKLDTLLIEVRETVDSTDDTLMKLHTRKKLANLYCYDNSAVPQINAQDKIIVEDASSTSPEDASKKPTLIATFKIVICMLVQLVEALVPVVVRQRNLEADETIELAQAQEGQTKPGPLCSEDVGKKIQNLITMKEKLLQGKVDAREFLLQFASVICCFSGVGPSELEDVVRRIFSCMSTMGKGVAFVADHCGSDGKLDALAQFPEDPRLSLDSSQLSSLQSELDQVKQEKLELEQNLSNAKEKLQRTKTQLEETEHCLSTLKAELSAVQISKETAEKDLAEVASLKIDLESRLTNQEVEVGELRDKMISLTAELEEKRQQHQDAVNKCDDLELQLSGLAKASTPGVANSKEHEPTSSRRSADDDEARLRKEREVTAAKDKLAECQRTIVVLGKQLRALTSPHGSPEASFNYSMDSVSSVDNKIIPGTTNADHVPHTMEDVHPSRDATHSLSLMPMERRKAGSGRVWARSDRRFDPEPYWSPSTGYVTGSMEPELYISQHRSQNGSHYPGAHYGRQMDMYRGNGLHSPLHEYAEGPTYMYSPPDTAMSSPARSPARFVQFSRRSSGSSVRTNLAKSMNRVASASSTKQMKAGNSSSFSRFFTRSKNHR